MLDWVGPTSIIIQRMNYLQTTTLIVDKEKLPEDQPPLSSLFRIWLITQLGFHCLGYRKLTVRGLKPLL